MFVPRSTTMIHYSFLTQRFFQAKNASRPGPCLLYTSGQLRVFLPVLLALGKQSFHRVGGRSAVNAFGVQIIQNCTAALALAQQLRRTAAGKTDVYKRQGRRGCLYRR